ncbi:ras-related protein Rab-37 isoform X5 [Mauremys reevesii]|uniref:ras-related protein Rab-37 isoform X5 n=1 Tax=Mauremys reevesii TaxID=260615 RepID=UPI00193F42FB|nr:ras-related protein Rab-37 isoform X5 [Mauremys reevesii]
MSGRAGSAAPAQNGGPAAAPERSQSLRRSYDLACKNKVVAVDGVKVKLQIWDTAGQERFRSVTHAYYRDAQALLLFYDITSKMSFDNIRAWLTEIHEYAQKDVVIMLLGNKADVSSERVIRMEDGESLAREYGVPFMETSAKTGMNVELAFLAIAKELKQRAVQQPDEPRFQIQDYIESQKKKSSCCSFMYQIKPTLQRTDASDTSISKHFISCLPVNFVGLILTPPKSVGVLPLRLKGAGAGPMCKFLNQHCCPYASFCPFFRPVSTGINVKTLIQFDGTGSSPLSIKSKSP